MVWDAKNLAMLSVDVWVVIRKFYLEIVPVGSAMANLLALPPSTTQTPPCNSLFDKGDECYSAKSRYSTCEPSCGG